MIRRRTGFEFGVEDDGAELDIARAAVGFVEPGLEPSAQPAEPALTPSTQAAAAAQATDEHDVQLSFDELAYARRVDADPSSSGMPAAERLRGGRRYLLALVVGIGLVLVILQVVGDDDTARVSDAKRPPKPVAPPQKPQVPARPYERPRPRRARPPRPPRRPAPVQPASAVVAQPAPGPTPAQQPIPYAAAAVHEFGFER